MKGMGGYRSHFELNIAKSLRQKGVIFEYEKRKVTFIPKPRTYTPDFYFPETQRCLSKRRASSTRMIV